MGGAAVIAAALTDHSAHPYSLWIDGLDVVRQPGQTGYGTDVAGVSLTLAGLDTVGSLSAVIDDPNNDVVLRGGEDVLFHDHTRDVPLFRGTVDTVTETMASGVSRAWRIQCSDLNAILDRVLVEPFDNSSLLLADTPRRLLMFALRDLPAPLRAAFADSSDGASVQAGGSATKPIGLATNDWATSVWPSWSRGSYRSMLSTVLTWIGTRTSSGGFFAGRDTIVLSLVDVYGNLRVWDSLLAIVPSDYRQTTVRETAGTVTEPAAVRPESLEVTIDTMQKLSAVWYDSDTQDLWITGYTNVGLDADLRPRREAVVTDDDNPNLQAISRGQAYLALHGAQIRARFTIGHRTTPFVIVPGDLITIDSDNMAADGLAGYVREIQTVFDGGGHGRTLTVTFGAMQASLARALT